MGEGLLRVIRDARRSYVPGLPRMLFWAIINHCNAVCITCNFYRVPRTDRTRVTLEEAKRAIDILWESQFRFTSVTGGEPLLNPDVFDICDAITRRGLVITYMPTNGLLVDDMAARRLRDADVKVVGISVEMTGADGMGATRKIPRFKESIMKARQALDRAGVENYAGVLLTRSNRDIREVVRFVQGLGFDKLVFSYPQASQGSSYLASRDVPDVDLSPGDIAGMVDGIKRAKREFKEIGIYNSDQSLDDLVRFYRGEPRVFGCWGGKRLFYMDWKLDLYRCFTLPERYGNLLEMGRVDVEEKSLCDLCTQQAFRDYGPLLAAGSGVDEARSLLMSGHPIRAAQTVARPEVVGGLKALMEVYGAGFI